MAAPCAPAQRFERFGDLHEDLKLHIISFVASAPLEELHARPRSALTGVLPLVCKEFYRFAQSEFLWGSALKRQLALEPSLWARGLLRLLPQEIRDRKPDSSSSQLVNLVKTTLRSTYANVYRMAYEQHILFTGPVFYMTERVRLEQAIGLHFFEPRYRYLIRQVMDDWPEEARHGGPIEANEDGDFPTFIYAHKSPLAPSTPACLVQVRECFVHADGSADVQLLPVAYVWLRHLWTKPNTGNLYYATCQRMGGMQTQEMEAREATIEREFLRHIHVRGGEQDPNQVSMQAILQYLMRIEPENGVFVPRGGIHVDEDSDNEEDDDEEEGEGDGTGEGGMHQAD